MARELIVVTKPDAELRARAAGLASAADADIGSLSSALARHGARLTPLFGLSEERLRANIVALQNTEVPDLATYYRVEAEDAVLDDLAAALRTEELVDGAYVKPDGVLPSTAIEATLNTMVPNTGDPPAVTPDFSAYQGYLDPAPGGIDARYAWTIAGGRGRGVRVVDCEWAWRFTHEDLTRSQGGVLAGTAAADQRSLDHGTAVLGAISGDHNGLGVIGIAADAWVAGSSFHDQSTAKAIRAAADKLGHGDILLLEIHRIGPRGYLAIEWWPDDFAAIRYAIAKGVIVVEAAGNGFQNLDDAVYDRRPEGFPSTWRNPFNAVNPCSGAIVVGAGAPPEGTHGADWGPDRSRLDFSNYGARVDAQGWGREVTSTGYGDLQGGTSQDLWYTNTFSGTSSAAPIVVGALACLQGILHERGPLRLTPARARALLRATGSPQQDAPGRPATQRIGNRPDLRQLIPAATRPSARVGDVDGDGRAEIVVTSPWGMGVLKQSGGALTAPMLAPNGTRFGQWLLDTADNQLDPMADFDGDGRSEILVSGPSGLGVCKVLGGTAITSATAGNGSRLGQWPLNTAGDRFGPAGDFDGDRRAEVLVRSPRGLGILKQSGTGMTSSMVAPNGTRFGQWPLDTADDHFGPVGDFDGDGCDEILVTSPWGIGILKQSGASLTVSMMAPNGSRFGQWLLNTADNRFGPVGDFDGDGHAEILVTSPWGIGILKLSGGTLSAPVMAPNGVRFGGWLLNTADNEFGPVGDFDGDTRAEILVKSPWGIGILKQIGGALTVPSMAPNGSRFGDWLLNTADDHFGSVADFDGDHRAELLLTSPWGVGMLKQTGATFTASMLAPNGARFGGWLLNTADNEFGG
ncbi:S8 family serine peptidase [Amycolatopsis sp. NPDC059657]|uniref:S8 family serine peptidase n=1 Tax=Amycolatopsis sp. NPDC059657 TaxID=3346899 RepID=UPI003672A73C